ncbi:MAG: ATP-binding protein [Kastovskya adunca ATA6-11-RM4]|jgi:hypothetical protein|nr:ATP-binding protein [Kastovskya adunca ATA6-11-RM4]
MRNELAKTRNIRLLSETHKELINLPSRVKERMGIIYGQSGLGKTTAIAWLAVQVSGIYLEASSNWTPYSMLGDLAHELGAVPMRSAKATEDLVIDRLRAAEAPLFIDEVDRIVDNVRLLETLRSVHDKAGIPVILIGMQNLDQKLAKREQLSSRLAKKLKFLPCDISDAKSLAQTCCEVGIEEDLIAEIHSRCKGSVRRIIVELAKVEAFVKSQRWEACNKVQWDAYLERQGGKR